MRQLHFSFFSVITALLLVVPIRTWAGTTGKVTGHIFDAGTNEPLIGANIIIEDTWFGAATS